MVCMWYVIMIQDHRYLESDPVVHRRFRVKNCGSTSYFPTPTRITYNINNMKHKPHLCMTPYQLFGMESVRNDVQQFPHRRQYVEEGSQVVETTTEHVSDQGITGPRTPFVMFLKHQIDSSVNQTDSFLSCHIVNWILFFVVGRSPALFQLRTEV